VLSSQLEPTRTLILVSSLLLARGIASLGALNSNLCDRNDSYPGRRAWTVGARAALAASASQFPGWVIGEFVAACEGYSQSGSLDS